MTIDVQPGATLGDYVDQLVTYLKQTSGPYFASMAAEFWVLRASGNAMPAKVAKKVAELALTAYECP